MPIPRPVSAWAPGKMLRGNTRTEPQARLAPGEVASVLERRAPARTYTARGRLRAVRDRKFVLNVGVATPDKLSGLQLRVCAMALQPELPQPWRPELELSSK
jgi:hypothetical protein